MDITAFGLLCAYMLIGLIALHQRPGMVEPGDAPSVCLGILRLSLSWPFGIGRG